MKKHKWWLTGLLCSILLVPSCFNQNSEIKKRNSNETKDDKVNSLSNSDDANIVTDVSKKNESASDSINKKDENSNKLAESESSIQDSSENNLGNDSSQDNSIEEDAQTNEKIVSDDLTEESSEKTDNHSESREIQNNNDENERSEDEIVNANPENHEDEETENSTNSSSENSSTIEDAEKVNKTAQDYYLEFPNAYKYFELTPEYFKLNSNREYLQKIQNRTFSIFWTFNNGNFTAGTFWLLDYKVIEEKKKYKLFLATNHHVAVDLFHDNDYSEYRQPNREKQIDQMIVNLKDKLIDNGAKTYSWNLSKNQWPRNFYLARNFIDNANNERSHYADFAVVEWDIDFSQINLRDSHQKAIAKRIINAMTEVDWSINQVQNNLSMNLKHNPYVSIDYGSILELRNNIIGFQNNSSNLNEVTTYQKAEQIDKYLNAIFSQTQNINYYFKPNLFYVYGHPVVNNRITTFSNVMAEDLDSFNHSDWIKTSMYIQMEKEYHNFPVASHGNRFNNEELPNFYGLAYLGSQRNRIMGGASGALVIYQDGMPLGIAFAEPKSPSIVYVDQNNKYATNYSFLFQQFVQQHAIYTNQGQIEKYNLIDGRDKNRYPHQKSSYKEQLIKVYGANYSTKLFENE